MISATCGIIFCLNNIGHPYIGMLFLLFCGLCDAFDGKVARTKACVNQIKKAGIPCKLTSYGTILMETDGKDWYVNQDYSSEKVKKQEKAEQKKK